MGVQERLTLHAIREPTLTILAFTLLGVIAWAIALKGPRLIAGLSLTFTRMCVILVNFGSWVGSLFGDSPGALWRDPARPCDVQKPPETAYIIATCGKLRSAPASFLHHYMSPR